jgi:uncharacterized protein (DUF427 family)
MSDRLRIEPTAKRIRAWVDGELLVDTTRALLVWESPHFPQYYLPRADVRTDLLVPSEKTAHSPSRGEAVYYGIRTGAGVAPDVAWEYPDSPIEAIREHIRVEWEAADRWFEEDELVHTHPRSPYTRIDALPSSRHVQVFAEGDDGDVLVADTHRPTLLFETGLSTRYYVPLADVRQDLLVPSPTTSTCPYKGTASYWSLQVGGRLHEDVVWTYPAPLPESVRIAGLACFYDERVRVVVDGQAPE